MKAIDAMPYTSKVVAVDGGYAIWGLNLGMITKSGKIKNNIYERN